jgi:hypothetical protein
MTDNIFKKFIPIIDKEKELNLPLHLRGSYKKMYVPNVIEKKKRNHYNKKEWCNVYHYVSQRTLKETYDLEFNLPLCVDKKYFRTDQFYKVCDLSKKDKLFDYYKILKQDLKDKNEIAIEKRRSRYSKDMYLSKNSSFKKHTNPNGYTCDFS